MNVADYAPFAGSIGGGFAAGALVGYAVKKVIKIAEVIVGLFIAALAYLQYQGIIYVDWIKFQAVSQGGLTTIANTIINVSNNFVANHNVGAFSDLIPLTSRASAGFMLGMMKG
jgi:uncharacterized membrane protein (Fun14 family)